jgi:LuxR family transcriptional regulator, quorum-sensing system regulator SdiA
MSKTLEFKDKDEELQFYKSILNNMAAVINVNQIESMTDPNGSFNIWANDHMYKYSGYTREEISALGFQFFVETMHPDDLQLIAQALIKFATTSSPIHGGMVRLKRKNGDYQWFIGNMAVMEMKDGHPWRVIVTVQNLEDMRDTRSQLIQLIKENLQLKHQLRFQMLSKREKEIVKLIALGKTDKEIAENLFISPATVKTHRHNIIAKLQVKNKAAIAQFATESGLD